MALLHLAPQPSLSLEPSLTSHVAVFHLVQVPETEQEHGRLLGCTVGCTEHDSEIIAKPIVDQNETEKLIDLHDGMSMDIDKKAPDPCMNGDIKMNEIMKQEGNIGMKDIWNATERTRDDEGLSRRLPRVSRVRSTSCPSLLSLSLSLSIYLSLSLSLESNLYIIHSTSPLILKYIYIERVTHRVEFYPGNDFRRRRRRRREKKNNVR